MAWFSPQPLTVPEVIALNAASLGAKDAVVVDDVATSWRDFGAGTARIANAMLDAGMAPGDRVVILMNNSYEMAEAMFGVTRAGLCAVPLNCSITDEAVAGMIADSAAKAVIASDEHIARIERLRARLTATTRERLIGLGAAPEGWRAYPA
ncbi:MAG: AMP-binding protein, partial [Woeseiaceae bacterium]